MPYVGCSFYALFREKPVFEIDWIPTVDLPLMPSICRLKKKRKPEKKSKVFHYSLCNKNPRTLCYGYV